jgi:hypothetical protein
MKRMGFWLVLALVVALPCAMAVDTYTLRLNLEKGDTFTQVVTTDQDITQEVMGQKQAIQQVVVMTYDYEVVDVSSADQYTVQMTFGRIQSSMQSMGQTMVYDSDSPPDAPNPAFDAYQAMIGKTLTITLRSNGKVEKLEGTDELIDAILGASPGAAGSAEMRAAMKEQYGDEALASMLQQSIAMFPDEPVAVGKSWTREMEITSMMPLDLKVTWTLEGVTSNGYKLGVAGEMVTPSDAKPRAMGMIPMQMRLSGTQSGTITLDRETGWAKSGALKQLINGTLSPEPAAGMPAEMQGASWPMTVKSDITIESR